MMSRSLGQYMKTSTIIFTELRGEFLKLRKTIPDKFSEPIIWMLF